MATTIDFDRVRAAADNLKKNPPNADEILKDPKAFLAAQGVQIDEALEQMINSRKTTNAAGAPRQAGIVHIDI